MVVDVHALPILELRRRILAALRRNGPRRVYELADELGSDNDRVLQALDWLGELGLVTVSRDGWEAIGA